MGRMPAFDPVRDAVLNSPVIQSFALPYNTHVQDTDVDRQEGHSIDIPSPSSSRPSSRATGSPSLTRRATDLAVLLNSDTQAPRTPSSAKPSSLSHLLLFDDDSSTTVSSTSTVEADTLSSVQSLRRRNTSLPTLDILREDVDNQAQPSSRQLSSTVSSRSFPAQQADTASHVTSASPSVSRVFPSSPLARSPVLPFSRPSSSSSNPTPLFSPPGVVKTTSSTMSQPPRPVAPSVPYNPRSRKTPAGSVLMPMTPQEIEMYKHYRGIGTQSLLAKRKRSRSKSPDDPSAPAAKRHAGDVGRVIEHYNLRPEVGVKQRLRSPIIGLKNFNNWVKSVLITRFAHPVFASSAVKSTDGLSGGCGKVLDMGCGKGGDLVKWEKARIRELIGVDIAHVSIEQARDRWKNMHPPRFTASFAALDCYRESLSKAFPPEKLAQPFDVVSMQFCMHYAFETAEKARCMLQNISRWLRRGGVFLGTIPNADYLLERLDSLPPSATDLSFGNSVYKIRFEDRRSRPLFGHRYYFWLQDAVDDVPEYIVRWDKFIELAAEYALYPIYKEEFHQIFVQHRNQEEFKSLMLRMKVVDANGESAMDEAQWEAANIYIGFVFEKR